MLNLTLTDPQNVNLIRKYGTEKYHKNSLYVFRVLACIYSHCIFMVSNQSDAIEFAFMLL